MAKKFPTNPSHPERICWGCDQYCPAKALACGNGADRTMHPVELFGEDWDSFDNCLEQPIAGSKVMSSGGLATQKGLPTFAVELSAEREQRVEATALVRMLAIGSCEYAQGKHSTVEELKALIFKKFSEG